MSSQLIKDKQDAIQLIENGLQYILGDLQTLHDNRKQFPMSYPQILLVFSGMEYLGALLYSKGSYSRKVENYISKWMPKGYNRREGNTSLGRFLYDSLRSGLVHYGNVKGDIVVDHDKNAQEHHLSWVVYKGRRRLFIHGFQFASDFKDSVERVKEAIDSGIITMDTLQKNTTRLETELEKSRKLNPNAQNNTDSDLEAWRNGTNWLANLPESTVGTTYKGGI